jgi:ribose-phosphate pyrophosphokinase
VTLFEDVLLFGGPGNPRLAQRVAEELPAGLAACEFRRFPDGEVSVRIDAPVRGRHVALVQPTGPAVNDHLMELLAFADACRRAAAASVTAIVPYFGYARSDRRQGEQVPVMASLAAVLVEAAGVAHVVTLDVHSPQLEGFFRIAVDNLTAVPVLAAALAEHVTRESVIVAPDLGAAKLAAAYGRALALPVAVVHKQRRSPTEVSAAAITGDVAGKQCMIVDDMITTGATIASAAAAVRGAGARSAVIVAASHGVLTDDAPERLAAAGVRELLLTDSLAVLHRERPTTRIVPVAPIIAEWLKRTAGERHTEAAHLFGSG